MTLLVPALYALCLYFAFAAGSLHLRDRVRSRDTSGRGDFRFPWTTAFLLLVIGVPTALQFLFPALLPALRRDATQVVGGEWWRLFTALLVQDGGAAGAAFNLIALALVGAVAEQLWNRRQVLGIFLVGAMAGEIVALAWQPIGAGNSVGNFALAGAIAVACLMRRPDARVRVLALLCLIVLIALLPLRDIHGAAGVAGSGMAFLLGRFGGEGRERGSREGSTSRGIGSVDRARR